MNSKEGICKGRDQSNRSLSRRKILQGVGQLSVGGAFISTATSSTASAKELKQHQSDIPELLQKYETVDSVVEAVNEHASILLTTLANRGLLASDKANDIINKPTVVSSENRTADQTIVFATIYDGELTSEIQINYVDSNSEILFVIKPEVNYSHVVIRKEEESVIEMLKVMESDKEDEDNITISSSHCCLESTQCHWTGGLGGDLMCASTEISCCDGDCVTGETKLSGHYCECDADTPVGACEDVECPDC